jgi:sterol desaturase/sphingolipid hydroxylase (fatty acid hydroxylase superfamily)
MEKLIAVIIIGTFFALLVVDSLRPARAFPEVRGWRLKGILFFALSAVVTTVFPLLWGELLARHRLIDASALGLAGGAIAGILVLDLAQFAWHVALHRSQLLWRFFHQVHHSAERIDTAGALYLSPLDMIGFTAVGSLALVWGIGVDPEAAIIANGVISVLAIVQHANVRTPRWLGYLIQRPENHTLHHGRDVHGLNYGSLAIWDMLCGTWRNPAEYDGEVGFYDGASRRLGSMLIGRDLAEEHAASVRARQWRPDETIQALTQRPVPAAQLWMPTSPRQSAERRSAPEYATRS